MPQVLSTLTSTSINHTIDVDTVDTKNASDFATSTHTHTGTGAGRTISTSAPSGGNSGDVWYVVT